MSKPRPALFVAFVLLKEAPLSSYLKFRSNCGRFVRVNAALFNVKEGAKTLGQREVLRVFCSLFISKNSSVLSFLTLGSSPQQRNIGQSAEIMTENIDPQSSLPQISSPIFFSRLKKLSAVVKKSGLDGFFVSKGKSDPDQPYAKPTVVQLYLFGYELPDTLMFIDLKSTSVTVVATKKKIAFLNPLASSSSDFKVKFVERSNKGDPVPIFEKVIDGWTGPIGTIDLKEREDGPVVKAWYDLIKKGGVEVVDAVPSFSSCMAVKEESEYDLLKKASVLTNKVFKNKLLPTLETTIDSNKSTTHETLAEEVNNVLEDPSKIGLKIHKDDVEAAFFPIVRSGDDCTLKVRSWVQLFLFLLPHLSSLVLARGGSLAYPCQLRFRPQAIAKS